MSDLKPRKILLVGNPNVGKSALFSRLTGVHAVSSNYPGTTVGFTEGNLFVKGERFRLIDVPGAYTIDPTNEAEEVAQRILLEGADIVVITIDATSLERNLNLALQVLELGQPSVVALNMVDEARHEGVDIDVEALEKELGVPVIPTVAVTGQGISDLVSRLDEARVAERGAVKGKDRWARIGEIVRSVQTIGHRHHSLRDRIEDLSVHPGWGALLGIFAILGSFMAVRILGEGMIDLILDPIFENFFMPLLEWTGSLLGGEGTFLFRTLIGMTIDGEIDPELSFGLLTTGLYVPLVMVLPYVVAFYAVLSFLEDVGYLPRFAVLFDALMHRIGLHGFAIVPTLLGLGCNVPGIMATRILDSRRERFIAATLISVAIPCAGLQAMIIGALGDLGGRYVLAVYGTLFLSWAVLGRILHKLLPGFSPELVVEIPPYRLPSISGIGFKLWLRVKGFLIEAIPLVLVGVFIANLLSTSAIMGSFSAFLSPLFRGVLGLPPETAGPILLGFLRKDIAVGMLLPMGLDPGQMVVAVVTLAMTFPCIATFIVLWRELGLRDMLLSIGIMILAALVAGGLLNALFALA
ncbi:MAG TPA: ferrous iron transporter B [Synergistetes bacterium]|nr:ferrous iron transporter B [Synergistota bacterium]